MRILIAEDDTASRKKLEFLLQSLGYEVSVAKDGAEAWAIWRAERPKLVITDWVMPHMDGLALCRKIRNANTSQYTYIIMVTGKQETQDLVMGMNAGADDFIAKPYNKSELAVRIRAGLRVVELESRDVIIMAISKLAESRDYDTGKHLDRMRYYCKSLAEHLYSQRKFQSELDEVFIENMYLTSPLHDIGKLGIPDRILNKPGKLTPDEFQIMKTHTTIGYQTLMEAAHVVPKAGYLKMSADIAKYHHEKYDGSGYPEGLEGEAIPLCARIVAVADVFDALMSKRVYKEAYPYEQVKAILLEGRGSHFDPIISDAFFDLETKFLNVYNGHQT